MGRKAEATSEFIIQKVSPIFNRKGYIGTSLSDLTEATGLTKGAIYCNFKNKEELAARAFKENYQRIISPLLDELNKHNSAIDKLSAITNYYRSYFGLSKKYGGCPVLNVGVDANHNNPLLFQTVKRVSKKIEHALEMIIREGIKREEIKPETDPSAWAKNIYCMIEGSIFMAFTQDDENYIITMMDMLDNLIKNKIRV